MAGWYNFPADVLAAQLDDTGTLADCRIRVTVDLFLVVRLAKYEFAEGVDFVNQGGIEVAVVDCAWDMLDCAGSVVREDLIRDDVVG